MCFVCFLMYVNEYCVSDNLIHYITLECNSSMHLHVKREITVFLFMALIQPLTYLMKTWTIEWSKNSPPTLKITIQSFLSYIPKTVAKFIEIKLMTVTTKSYVADFQGG